MKRLARWAWGKLRCVMGFHDTYSYWQDAEQSAQEDPKNTGLEIPDYIPEHLKPTLGDSSFVLVRKHQEVAKTRCRRCSYTYPR